MSYNSKMNAQFMCNALLDAAATMYDNKGDDDSCIDVASVQAEIEDMLARKIFLRVALTNMYVEAVKLNDQFRIDLLTFIFETLCAFFPAFKLPKIA